MSFMETLKKSFEVLKKNWPVLLGLTLAYQAIDISFMKLIGPGLSSGNISFFYALMFLVMWLIRVAFLCGYVPLVTNCISGKKVKLSDYKEYVTKDRFISFMYLDAIVMVVLIAGMLLLIVPGIYWSVVSIFAYFILSSSGKSKDVLKSITDSINISSGKKWKIFGYQLLYFTAILLSALHPVVSLTLGVFVTSLYWVTIGTMFKEKV